MPSRSDAALQHIRDNILLACHIVGDMALDDFAHDRVKFYAATRCLEIISEAARRLSSDVLKRHPDLPWRKIMDAGNHYRHAYDGVEERFVYTTIKEALPALQTAVTAEIARP